MKAGCYTALITPFKGDAVDWKGLDQLIDFQIQNGITGILAVGTTGESPVLNWEEHNDVTENIAQKAKNKCICIAGTGSNNTQETLEGTRHAVKFGAQAVLLVDPYYNGPSSLEIRREYIYPVAKAFPQIDIIPYVIPGRTGTQLLPEDIGLAYREYPNVNTVKEATGSIENMRRTRECCGPDFTILSGDDPMTVEMMTDSQGEGGRGDFGCLQCGAEGRNGDGEPAHRRPNGGGAGPGRQARAALQSRDRQNHWKKRPTARWPAGRETRSPTRPSWRSSGCPRAAASRRSAK